MGVRINDVSGSQYRIEGLEAGMTYDVYVAARCAEGVVSNWSQGDCRCRPSWPHSSQNRCCRQFKNPPQQPQQGFLLHQDISRILHYCQTPSNQVAKARQDRRFRVRANKRFAIFS